MNVSSSEENKFLISTSIGDEVGEMDMGLLTKMDGKRGFFGKV